MKEYFQTWGNFYQVVCSIIFGLITVLLWFQDRRKSRLIFELQKQSNLLLEQLDIIKNQNRPCLRVTNKKYDSDYWQVITIENSGSDLFNLDFNNKSSPGNIFKIDALSYPKHIARDNSFDIRFQLNQFSSNYHSSILKFIFSDNLQNKYEQILILSNKPENICFKPADKI